MQANRIRPIVLAVIVHAGRLLVAEFCHPDTGQLFYRPLGGTIEFGETGEQALRRELREELSAEVSEPEFLFVMDNIFTFREIPAHELVLVYRVDFLDPGLAQQGDLLAHEDTGESMPARWLPPGHFHPQLRPLYPVGLLEQLQERGIL